MVISQKHQSSILSSSSNFSIPLFLFSTTTNWIIYFVISIYLELVYPGSDFIGLSPIFFLKPSFWKSMFGKKKEIEIDNLESPDSEIDLVNEQDDGIQLIGVSKIFSEGIFQKEIVNAVDDLYLDIFKGEIFTLLGHNGAGFFINVLNLI
jgi:ATP-binding cassette, subfamily A (ABC1), member 3